ncbi:hypothetical protein [Mesorhizobium sp. L-2-11]|uniref:hypothetical protein n=1 Tax=Mesorhizobium sp. L-2-11 TaxID=2744521 RepID=UPI001927722D|nr:hypothetical protein [Mesorhizobium sp. L-2-11]BCH19670.1 hypothetical protein MesoLjLa_65210 [Mesorhizobium sp. L-2-11]
MTQPVADARPEKSCPRCQSTIAKAAVVCPVCQSDIAEQKQNGFVTFARFLKDWIGFPTAVVAAVALIGPATNAVLAYRGKDGATLTLKYVGQNIVNIGLDDTPVTEQPNEVFAYIPYVRQVLVNSGLSPATIQTAFTCYRSENGVGQFVGNFYFIDLRMQKRLADDPKLGPGESVLVDIVVRDISPIDTTVMTFPASDTCTLPYTDKYGTHTFSFPAALESGTPSLFSLDAPEDRRVALREKFCPNMVRGLHLGSESVDCVDDSHVFAIEPVYLWQDGLQRVLRQSGGFHQITQGGATRAPGLVLTGCSAPNCSQQEQEMRQALRSFTPAVAVWLCPPEVDGPNAPATIDFKKDCPPVEFSAAPP